MPKSYKIAVVGAGLAGLATFWHLLQKRQNQPQEVELHLIEAKGIAKGASGAALGLLHPFAGSRCRLNWRGLEGVASTSRLLAAASSSLALPLARRVPLLRIATHERQGAIWQEAVRLYPQFLRPESIECARWGAVSLDAQLIECSSYLEGLWLDCARHEGVYRLEQRIRQLDQLDGYDAFVLAMGAETLSMQGLPPLPLHLVKGQLLEVALPAKSLSLSTPIGASSYLLPSLSCADRWLIGASYERRFTSPDPDKVEAQQLLLPPLFSFLPELKAAELVGCRAGLRVMAPGHRPLIQQVAPRGWVATGLGSKGLLYHGLVGLEAAALAWQSLSFSS